MNELLSILASSWIFIVALAVWTRRGERRDPLDTMYKSINEIVGTGDPNVTNASTTIDEVLYGEDGAWQDEPSEQGLWELPNAKSKS